MIYAHNLPKVSWEPVNNSSVMGVTLRNFWKDFRP